MSTAFTSEQGHALLEETFPEFPPVSLTAARETLEGLRHRRIRIVVSAPAGLVLPTGLWAVLGTDTDLVWADATLSPTHQLVTICHEFGHMICGHSPSAFAASPSGVVDGVAPDVVARIAGVPLQLPSAALGRCGVDLPRDDVVGRRREQEAEVTGRILARPFLDTHQAELSALLLGH